MSYQGWKKITILFLSIILVLSSFLPSLSTLEASAKSNVSLTDEISEYTRLSLSDKIFELISKLENEKKDKQILEIKTEIEQYINSDDYLGFNRVRSESLLGLIKQLIPKLKDEEQQKEWTRVALALNKIAIEDLEVIASADISQARKAEAKQTKAKKQYEQAVSLYEKQNYNGAVSHVDHSFKEFFNTLKLMNFEYKLDADSDQDGLLNIEEFVYKTNPLKADSDDDNLSDSFEFKQLYTDPLGADSNENGIRDDKEDKDSDHLSNKQEQDLKTNPLKEDTDDDKLNDEDEIKSGTNPTNSDTDQDKLMDGEESPLGFDPTKKDTNGNGINDGDEFVTVTTTPDSENQDEHVVPSVTIHSPAADSGTITITNIKDRNSFLEEIPGYLGSAYEFETEVQFDEAQMTFTYDPSVVTKDFRPEIFFYNEKEQRLERLENQTHDPQKRTVTAKVAHFSKYLLLNGVEWDKTWSEDVGLSSDNRGEENNGDIRAVADDTTGDEAKDTDKDGLPDALETEGIRVGNGKYIVTDPNEADSDGDGLLDGEEILIDEYNGNQYGRMVSDPNKLDSDNDDLIDTEEIQFGTHAFDSDTDGDSLSDSKEVRAGFHPIDKNPDKDQYPDAEEMNNGTDPFIYDETAWEFGQNLLLGALWGDGGETAVDWGIISENTYNSVAYLTGQIVSGLVAIGDIRDAIGNIANGNPLGVVLSLVGFIPAVGDGAKIIEDIISFAKRTNNNLDKAIYFVNKILRKFDDSVADDALRKLAGACSCFTAGTLILTDEGEKPIEEIKVGDRVLSKNEQTGETAYKEVTQLFQNEKYTTYQISIGNQVIETTNNHPFWVEGKGWVLGEDLEAGDKLQQTGGNVLEIKNIEIVQHKKPVKVYNFTVADFHTYYVSNLGIWVHNEEVCTVTIKWGIHTIQARPFGKGYFGTRIPQTNPRVDAYELKINPNNESFYLPHPEGGNVQFENIVSNTVQDGKLIMSKKSFYYVEDLPPFARAKVLQEARRQIDAAKAAEYEVEWLVSDEKAVEQLQRLFQSEGIPITVKHFPE
ncbi:MAG TPA: polymorphic toxin-type HINT domain-containing protein [Bacillus sp. (in: firmicutes)]|nr:polymorphic toxin-type HINT domain-containing protein [Bacillus sp. (in: firmicutes)]